MTTQPTLLFEDAVFSKISSGKSRTARQNADTQFEDLVARELLNFTALRTADRNLRVAATEYGYRVDFSRSRVAFDFMSLMAQDNPEINLEFTEDLLNYKPDEELVRKSKVPLWVIQQIGPRSVIIKRMW